MWAKRICIAGLVVYGALSVTDFVQTYALIESSGGRVYEANPVAAHWLDRFGWAGLAAFKAAAVLVVASVIAVLVHRRPTTGVAITALACASVGLVTLRSHHYVTTAELDRMNQSALMDWKPVVRSPTVLQLRPVPAPGEIDADA